MPETTIITVANWLKQAIDEGYLNYHEFDKFSDIMSIDTDQCEVYRADWKIRGMVVALKSWLNISSKEEREVMDGFSKELKLLRKVDYHPNILRFFGVNLSSQKHLLVLEYANSGTLRQYLQQNHHLLTWKDKISLGQQVVSGVACLHDNEIPLRELNANNVLVKDGSIKIYNIGLSNQFNQMSEAKKNEIGYTDPQILKNSRHKRNTKSDIFSVGILLWEISSGRPPFQSSSLELSNGMSKNKLATKISEGKREEPVKGTPVTYVDIYQQCWQNDPNKRPTIHEVHEKLSKIVVPIKKKSIDNCLSTINNENSKGINVSNEIKCGIGSTRPIRTRKISNEKLSLKGNPNNNGNISNSATKFPTDIGMSGKKSPTTPILMGGKKSPTKEMGGKKHTIDKTKPIQRPNSFNIGRKPQNRRSSFNNDPTTPTTPTTPISSVNKRLIDNADTAFFEDLLNFFINVLEISSDNTAMISSIKDYLHNKSREHKSTFKSLIVHKDNPAFCSIIGFFYENSIGTVQDKQAAFNSYKKSAESSDAIGQYFLGRCYYLGQGIKTDRKKAFELLQKSAENGNSRGRWMLGFCYERGYGTEKDLKKAFDQFLQSAEAGNTTSQIELGRCYEEGIGVKKNLAKAIECYQHASARGNVLANKKIEALKKIQRKNISASKVGPKEG
ncbi:6642_t:CDS:2 [Diversispora eburnea]|uniref:6642_t:CDS:1 n=1 Tax=Diversispora eburnea TaxID=1213867 RepID=A0A9N8YXL5_9GLOM|nr:6642_t:CDS:2 [Diversispora eburnea]